jgi:chitinase
MTQRAHAADGSAAALGSVQPKRVVAYLASWSVPATIPAQEFSVINFAFAHIDKDGRAVFEQPGVGDTLSSLRRLKKQNPRLRIIASVGGWQAEGFSDAALTDASRRTFARSVVQLLREYSLDGVDLDWEYPGQRVAGIKYRSEDKHNFTLLLQTLREQLDAAGGVQRRTGRDHYILTIAAADREYLDHTEMDRAHVYLDWINLMTYDFFNRLTRTTGHHAGLYPSKFSAPNDRNADAAVRQYLAAGVPADKIVLGVAFYGRGFAGVVPVNNGINEPYQRFEGEHSYAELVDKFIGKQGFVRYWDEDAQAPYLWNSSSRTFISYDDPQSVDVKSRYVLEHRLGGVMFWELSQDRNGELLGAVTHQLNDGAPLNAQAHPPR